jgi:hypothetical protein
MIEYIGKLNDISVPKDKFVELSNSIKDFVKSLSDLDSSVLSDISKLTEDLILMSVVDEVKVKSTIDIVKNNKDVIPNYKEQKDVLTISTDNDNNVSVLRKTENKEKPTGEDTNTDLLTEVKKLNTTMSVILNTIDEYGLLSVMNNKNYNRREEYLSY